MSEHKEIFPTDEEWDEEHDALILEEYRKYGGIPPSWDEFLKMHRAEATA